MISEEIENELEALRAIYGDDFEERPPVWKRPCFVIKVRPTTSVNGEVHVETTGEFDISLFMLPTVSVPFPSICIIGALYFGHITNTDRFGNRC